MAKDPAFLFYSKDFLSGVQDLTMEERGQYITLLCLQHQKGRLSDKMIRLSLGNAAADVMAKFRQDSGGLWYNERLELESEKRRIHGEKQSQRAKEGWERRKKESHGNNHGNAAALPLVNANGNVNGIEELLKEALSEIFLDQEKSKWKHVDFDFELNTFRGKVAAAPEQYATRDTAGIKLAFLAQLRFAKSKPKNGSVNPGKLQ